MVRHDVNQETGHPGPLTDALRLIRERSDSGEDSVLVLAAQDPDGVCASVILTSVLKLEAIKYTLLSVSTYTALEEALNTLRSSVRTVVLLNCGAVVDLTKHVKPDVVLIVIDSHRPIHLNNVTEPEWILVLDDDLGRGAYFPSEAVLESAHEGERTIEDILFYDEPEDGGGKRSKTDSSERDRIIREYYEGYYYGSPTALVVYAMASDLGYHNQQLLWLACVALAGYLEQGFFSPDTFRAIAQEIDSQHMPQFAPSIENIDQNTTTSGLRFAEDLKLHMHRHWSLFQAMWHTPYVYAKLELHRDHGHGTMQKLLVFAGVSPQNYNQTFSSMSHSSKSLVGGDKFKRKCVAFGLDEIKHYQFVRTVRMKDAERPSLMVNELAASDLYFMLSSAIHTKGFNFAISVATNAATLADLHECISKSLDVHRDICVQAKMILDKRDWRKTRAFRYCVIRKPTSTIFQQCSESIRWLAMFLMTVLRSHSEGLLPFLICIKTEEQFICLGADPQDTKSEFVFRFRSACEATAVKIQLNSFDFALAHVPAAEFETWTQALLGGAQEGLIEEDTEDEDEE